MDIYKICYELGHGLCAVYHTSKERPHLILPTKRDDSARISEQESKILFSQELEKHGIYYSIETPTCKTYIQSGTTPLSARIDITVYKQHAPTSRILNIELKAGNPPMESFRKDFEKLIRENINGLWFHTLISSNERIWQNIFSKIRQSLHLLEKYTIIARHKLIFIFCVLNTRQLYTTEIILGPQFSEEVQRVFGYGSFSWFRIDLLSNHFTTEKVNLLMSRDLINSKKISQSYSTPKRGKEYKALIYCPEIASESFIHLSTQGERYALSSFVGIRGRKRFKMPGMLTTSALRPNYNIIHEINVTDEKVNLDKQPDYWEKRINELNVKYQIKK